MNRDERTILAYLATREAGETEREIFFSQFNGKRVNYILGKWDKRGRWEHRGWDKNDVQYGHFTRSGAIWAGEELGIPSQSVRNCPTNEEDAMISKWEDGNKDEMYATRAGGKVLFFIPSCEEPSASD